MRVFLDANILFSAAQSHSRMRVFLDVLMDRVMEFLPTTTGSKQPRYPP